MVGVSTIKKVKFKGNDGAIGPLADNSSVWATGIGPLCHLLSRLSAAIFCPDTKGKRIFAAIRQPFSTVSFLSYISSAILFKKTRYWKFRNSSYSGLTQYGKKQVLSTSILAFKICI